MAWDRVAFSLPSGLRTVRSWQCQALGARALLSAVSDTPRHRHHLIYPSTQLPSMPMLSPLSVLGPPSPKTVTGSGMSPPSEADAEYMVWYFRM